jgi:hypothetical protein
MASEGLSTLGIRASVNESTAPAAWPDQGT